MLCNFLLLSKHGILDKKEEVNRSLVWGFMFIWLGCHAMHRCSVVSNSQLCLTLCNLMDCSLPGSSVREIFQARILEWVSIYSWDLPDPGIQPCLLHCQVNSLSLSHLGSLYLVSEANISHSVFILACCFAFGLCRESLNGVSDFEVLFTCMLCYCIALYWYGGKVVGSNVVLWIGLSFLNLICVSLLLFEGWRELELGKVLPGQLGSVKIIFFSDCPF